MPIEDLNTDVSAIDWSVGTFKSDKRMTYHFINPEFKRVGSAHPYTVRLEEKPYQTSGVEITGYTESLVMPTSELDFYVDFEDSTVYFHSSQAGKLVKIYYYGMGSVVAANDMNRFANFLCSVRDFLTSFQVEAADPVSTNANMTGGYINTGTDLVKIADKILKFGTGEEFEVSAMSAFYWRKLLISVNTSTESIVVTEGVAASTQLAAVIPTVPTRCKPCAVISVQDNGDAGVGTIKNIAASEIEDIRALDVSALAEQYEPRNTTKLAITGKIAAGTNFLVTSSGVSYTFSGDNGNLLVSSSLFEATEYIRIFLNGVYMIKGVQVTWQSQTSFQLDIVVDNGDEIIILS